MASLGLFLLLVSCSIAEESTPVCIDGSCDAAFRIDTQVNPGSFQDSDGVWHIKYSGYSYFTVKGIADQLNSENIVNGTPLIETGFDSDFFFTPENLQWTYPVYSFLGLTSNNTLTTAIPCFFKSSAGPIPESCRTCGVLIAPPHRTTFFARYSIMVLPRWATTPTALSPSKITRCTW
jgi:hypothetical protein